MLESDSCLSMAREVLGEPHLIVVCIKQRGYSNSLSPNPVRERKRSGGMIIRGTVSCALVELILNVKVVVVHVKHTSD